jgi:hypothetical protein
MSRSTSRFAGVITGFAALALGMGAVFATPAAAAKPNPCKVLSASEIQTAFGGAVAAGKKVLSTPVSSQCEFQVSASADRPAGSVIVRVMTTGAKAAHDGLKKTDQYVPVDGVSNGLYADKLHVVEALKGSVLLGVQGTFVITDPLPVRFYDARSQLVDLAKQGLGRV